MKTKLILLLLVLSNIVNAQYTKLYDLFGAYGISPYGDLYSDGTYLFGMNRLGGANGSGTIIKIKLDGSGMTNILDFGNTLNSKSPWGSLTSDGTDLYGMTNQGGLNNMGTIFKVSKTGFNFTSFHSFNSATGNFPTGNLIIDGTVLYGLTDQGGGANSFGVIFKINTDGSLYTKLYTFSVTANGKTPIGALYDDGTYLFGATARGGVNDMGTLYKIKKDGTGFTKLYDFSGFNGDGPRALISDGTYIYGVTRAGGTMDSGVVYKILPDGAGYTKLHEFAGLENGAFPTGSLISDGTYLYGMTSSGGNYGKGIIFKVKTDGNGFTKMLDFSGTFSGAKPYGSLIIDGNSLYGMTYQGGSNDGGTIFKINVNTTVTGIEEKNINNSLSVFPNPASSQIQLDIPKHIKAELRIFNLIGEEVIFMENYKSGTIIDVSNLIPGTYFYQIKGEGNTYSGKLIKG